MVGQLMSADGDVLLRDDRPMLRLLEDSGLCVTRTTGTRPGISAGVPISPSLHA